MFAVLRLLLLSMVFVVTGASAQIADSVKNVDDIVNVFNLKKKGTLPFLLKFGATKEEIKVGMGGAEVFKEDSSYVTYTLYFSKDKYDFADITFELSGGKTTDVSIEAYFGEKEPAAKAFNLLKMNFDKLYRKGEYFNQALKWKYSKKEIKMNNKKGTILQQALNLWIQLKEIEFEGDNGFVLDFLSAEPE